mgnify:CR=1 FL=1
MNNDLISQKAQTKNINKIKASSAEIVVHGTKEKPYYEIKYFDLSDNKMHIGYSSYNLDNVLRWLEEYFEISEMGEESETERLKRRLNEAEYNRDFCIKQLIAAVEKVDKYKEELKNLESE